LNNPLATTVAFGESTPGAWLWFVLVLSMFAARATVVAPPAIAMIAKSASATSNLDERLLWDILSSFL
jgi:hypothetical protein